MDHINRPFDFLNKLIEKKVIIKYNGKVITGILVAFDINLNLILDNANQISPEKETLGSIFLRINDTFFISKYGGK